MLTVRTPAEVRGAVGGIKRRGKVVGFVPTMGGLHDGHASLVRLARDRTDFVVASIFVNPKQFGPREDLARYPRDEQRDREILEGLGCDLLFAPSTNAVYSPADRTRVHVEGLSEVLCGSTRIGHFDGVALIVAKLFNIVQPDIAFFGQKDAQQAVVIQRMAADLDFPVRILLGPTIRETDGLAMSSRNTYLSGEARVRAAELYRALRGARRGIEEGDRDPRALERGMRETLARAGFDVDYAAIVDAETLRPLETLEGRILVAAAGRIGGTRLIDNIALDCRGDAVKEILLEFPEWRRYDE
jgi:pantoate--beta-alanine ligase